MTYDRPQEFFEKIGNDREFVVFFVGAQLHYKDNKGEDNFYLDKLTKFLKSKGIDNQPTKISKRPFGFYFQFGTKKIKMTLENKSKNKYKVIAK